MGAAGCGVLRGGVSGAVRLGVCVGAGCLVPGGARRVGACFRSASRRAAAAAAGVCFCTEPGMRRDPDGRGYVCMRTCMPMYANVRGGMFVCGRDGSVSRGRGYGLYAKTGMGIG